MTTRARFLTLLLATIFLAAGCAKDTVSPTETILPKSRPDTRSPYQGLSDSDVGHGQQQQPSIPFEDEAADFVQEGWSSEERAAANYISNAVIYFYFDSFTLTPEAQAVLKQKAIKMKEFPQFTVVIGGHCDERGTDEYNIALGERRARAAFDFLVQSGAPVRQLEMISYGKLHPAARGVGETVWSQNRRAEFKVTKRQR